MSRREFQFVEGSSSKFWAIELKDKSFTVHFGRIGTSGQASEKSFPTEAAAQKEYDKLILEKTKKGYVEVAGSTGATGIPAPKAKTTANAEPDKEASAPNRVAETPPINRTPPPVFSSEVTRSISLDPHERFLATWLDHEPLPRPNSPQFNLEDALERLQRIGDNNRPWTFDWKKGRIPNFPSEKEARFWLRAFGMAGRKFTPQQIAAKLSDGSFDAPISTPEITDICAAPHGAPENLFACIVALVKPLDLLELEVNEPHGVKMDLGEVFLRFVLPYLTRKERAELKEAAATLIQPVLPATFRDQLPPAYRIGALVGCSDELYSYIKIIPEDRYSYEAEDWEDYYHRPQWLVFGLNDPATIQTEFKRLGLRLRTRSQARGWLAVTGYNGLDELASSACRARNKEGATEIANVLLQVIAPEAAVPALRIQLETKAPQFGLEWLKLHPLEAAIGLVPAAMEKGKLAEGARDYLRRLMRSEAESIVPTVRKHIPAEQADWLDREIVRAIESEKTVQEIPSEQLPPDLGAGLSPKKPFSAPQWLDARALPPIKVAGGKLTSTDVQTVLSTLKSTPLDQTSDLFAALKSNGDSHALDNFAWKLFELWLSGGAISKDKWALGAIGHIGGDASVLKVTPMIREWPGESQHQRAVFGLECLRKVGTDTALMALNGIAQKLKFKGLKEKAQGLMEDIAKARGLTSEQLADRIVPDCGLDERGSRVFDFGPRQFRFALGPEMKPLIRDAGGKVRPDLPAPNSSDDAAKAEAAVAEWKLLKKTLREALKIQAERLEDAMITGRRWSLEEFVTLLVRQPLMVNLSRLLVFAVYDDRGAVANTFRVTEDQAFADCNDEAFELPASGTVGIIHPAHLDEATKGAWGQVLSDYEIIPPFPQLGRPICRADAADLNKEEITSFRGPKIPGIVMYGMLERSHWVKDHPADGGGFMQHSKYFPAAEVTAFIQYTGLSIGYYEEPQELQSVYFVPGYVEPQWWGDHKNRVKIKDVDEVVMSEVLRLAHAIVSKAE